MNNMPAFYLRRGKIAISQRVSTIMIIKEITDLLTENNLNIHGIEDDLLAHVSSSKHPDKVILQKDILKALLFLREKNILTEKHLVNLFEILGLDNSDTLSIWIGLLESYYTLVSVSIAQTELSIAQAQLSIAQALLSIAQAIDDPVSQLTKILTFDDSDSIDLWIDFLAGFMEDSIPYEVRNKSSSFLSVLVISEGIKPDDLVENTKLIQAMFDLLFCPRADIKARIDAANALGMICSPYEEDVDKRIVPLFRDTQTLIALTHLFNSTPNLDLKPEVLSILTNILVDEHCNRISEGGVYSKIMTNAGIIPGVIEFLQTTGSEKTLVVINAIVYLLFDNADAVNEMEDLDIINILSSVFDRFGDDIFVALRAISDIQLRNGKFPEQIIADKLMPLMARVFNEKEGDISPFSGARLLIPCIGDYIKSNSSIILSSIKKQGILKDYLSFIFFEQFPSDGYYQDLELYVSPYDILKCLAYDLDCHKAIQESGVMNGLMKSVYGKEVIDESDDDEDVMEESHDGEDVMPLKILKMISRRKVENTIDTLFSAKHFRHLCPDIQCAIAKMLHIPKVDDEASAFNLAEAHLKLITPLLHPLEYEGNLLFFSTQQTAKRNTSGLEVEDGPPRKYQKFESI